MTGEMTNKPSWEEWQRLFGVALRFKEIEPWTWMYDEYLFGVENPEDNEIGFCCVIGNLGELLGLIVYMGQSGLESYLTIMSSPEDLYDNISIQDCISLTFNDRKYLDKYDLSLIKGLNLKFRGKKVYPQFRRLRPMYLPSYLTKKECSFLTIVLEQAINVCLRAKDDKRLLTETVKTKNCLVRYFDNGEWKDKIIQLDTTKKQKVVSIQVNEIKLTAIKKSVVKSAGKWEIDFFVNTIMPIKDKENPYYPLITFIVDHSSGHIFNCFLTEPSNYQQKIFDDFIGFVERVGIIPQEIFVEKTEVESILQPVSDAFGIKLIKVKKCSMVKKAQNALLAFERLRLGRENE